jgi:hypothetical protein
MSTYNSVGNGSLSDLTLNLQETHLYGSSRIGTTARVNSAEQSWYPFPNRAYNRGYTQYELTNHLGNVLTTLSDKKRGVQSGVDTSLVAYFNPVIENALDYYPFGMVMPARTYYGNSTYRYGFNGQEKSTEIDPNGNSMTAEFWEYDARLGRRWNLDPVLKVHESPYLAFAGNPIWLKDPLGNDTTRYYNNDGALLMTIGNAKAGYNRAMVVKDDKVKAVQEYASKYKAELNSKSGVSNNVAVDNYFKSYGDLYDLNSFVRFYESYKNSYNIKNLRGVSVDQLTSIKLNEKAVSKDYLKSLKGAEATAIVKKVNGIFTVDFNSVGSDNDAFQSTRPYNSDMSNYTHIHLHPFWNMDFEYTFNWDGKPQWRFESARGDRNGAITGDIDRNSTDGRTRSLPRTIVVSDKSIRLLTGTLSETIKIQR